MDGGIPGVSCAGTISGAPCAGAISEFSRNKRMTVMIAATATAPQTIPAIAPEFDPPPLPLVPPGSEGETSGVLTAVAMCSSNADCKEGSLILAIVVDDPDPRALARMLATVVKD